jgi:hypothetical protein
VALQLNRASSEFAQNGRKDTSVVMSDEDARRYVDNFESMAAAISQ